MNGSELIQRIKELNAEDLIVCAIDTFSGEEYEITTVEVGEHGVVID